MPLPFEHWHGNLTHINNTVSKGQHIFSLVCSCPWILTKTWNNETYVLLKPAGVSNPLQVTQKQQVFWNTSLLLQWQYPFNNIYKINVLRTNKLPNVVLNIQLLSCVQLFVTPRTAACQASLSITNFHDAPVFTELLTISKWKHGNEKTG